jgi:hypothetical protein
VDKGIVLCADELDILPMFTTTVEGMGMIPDVSVFSLFRRVIV